VPSATRARFKQLRECLQKNGVTLGKREPGRTGPGAGPPARGTPPRATNRTQLGAAMKKCATSVGGFGGLVGGGRRLDNPALRRTLAKFAACMREHGVNLPEPNTSGTGPVFNPSAVDTAGATFRAAQAKCRGDLVGLIHAHPGGAPPPNPRANPPSSSR
jgi:cytochrome c556